MTIQLLIYCRSAQPWSSFSLPGSDVCCPPLCVPLATSTYVRAFSRPHPLPSQHFILFLSNRCYFSLSRSCTLSDVSTLYHHNASLKCSLHVWDGMQHPGWHHCRALLVWLIFLCNVLCGAICISLNFTITHLRLRDAYLLQNGWIFGKVPNGLWPPPPSLSESYVANFLNWLRSLQKLPEFMVK